MEKCRICDENVFGGYYTHLVTIITEIDSRYPATSEHIEFSQDVRYGRFSQTTSKI